MKVGVALGGGGARGYAHFGVLYALEKNGIQIDCLAGTSIGAAIGALWATMQTVDCFRELRKLTRSGVWNYLDLEIPTVNGLFRGEKLYHLLQSWFMGYRIEHLTREFCANAVELETGREVTFTSGSVSDAVRASVSLPMVLSPWKIGHSSYVDGGVVNPLPIKQCREMGADVVIAVDLLGVVGNTGIGANSSFRMPDDLSDLAEDMRFLKKLLKPAIPSIAFSSILLSQKALTDSILQSATPAVLIRPDLSMYSGDEFHMVEEISEKGKEAAELMMPDILRSLRS
ncbi:hypothetical protein CSA37_08110 [Candidatus Fermentibacteria bacterium]|nr:MAG: hypothetical protein CSA37_08110 [Candidatus Fermentibacteria bacterium]